MLPAYKESYTHYTTPSGNTQIYLYRKKPSKNLILRKQKILGVILVILGIIGAIALPEDNGGFILAAFMGIARIAYK